MTRKSYEASFLTWTMVNSALDYSLYETVRLHQRFWKCAVDFEMLLYSQQLTVRGRSPRMHFRVYEMQKAGSQDPLALHTTWQGAETCRAMPFCWLSPSQNPSSALVCLLWNLCSLTGKYIPFSEPPQLSTYHYTIEVLVVEFYNSETQYLNV